MRALFLGTVTGNRAYANTNPQSLAPKIYEEYPRHGEVTHGPCLQHLAMWCPQIGHSQVILPNSDLSSYFLAFMIH